VNQVALWKAIKARAEADTGSGGLFGTPNLITGIYNTLAVPTLTDQSKYVVFSVAAAAQEDAFDTDVVTYIFRLSVFSPVAAGLAVPSAIIDRLYGNGVSQSGNLASYGFHRWKPTLSGTSWNADVMHRIDQDTNHTATVYQFVETYQILCSLS
jgi:hypothetical protein